MQTNKKVSQILQSPVGRRRIDCTGAAVGIARMNPDMAYGTIPLLLKEYIDGKSDNSWQEIRKRIDNIYVAVSSALEILDANEPFSADVRKLAHQGKKLFFKPNMVSLPIDVKTHAPVLIGTCTPWEFVATVMRWFHDKQEISYYQMAMGEAGTTNSLTASIASKITGTNVTTLSIMEGKYGNNYGGWGFYFVRKYLADCHDLDHDDNPMHGYEESLAGVCMPLGTVSDKLLIYDLNKIADDSSNGRDVPVADGINYKTITLHKAIVGGDPTNARDRRNWPGCVLVNVAKLKIHALELLTAAAKNIGIGLYPMEASDIRERGKSRWKYAIPNLEVPTIKFAIPHTRWVSRYDEENGDPLRDESGNYLQTETGGLEATIGDIIQAVKGQGIRILNIIDAIEASNIDHFGAACTPVPEGLIFASNDIVAVDACAARYLFNMVPIAETDGIRKTYDLTSDVIQRVPMPKIKGSDIITEQGYDSAFSRYPAFEHWEERGLGQRKFYVVGCDLWQSGTLVSLKQHLGRVSSGNFNDLITGTLYHVPTKMLWDLQATSMAYLECNDRLTGSNFKRQILDAYDADGDGIIDYTERGRFGIRYVEAHKLSLRIQDKDPLELLKLDFLLSAAELKLLKRQWNIDGHNLFEPTILSQGLQKAFAMSLSESKKQDPFFPNMAWGNGKWPSMQYAIHQRISDLIYGPMFPDKFDSAASLYSYAFCYADARWNGRKYSDNQQTSANGDSVHNYHQDVARGAPYLPFTLYVPGQFGSIGNSIIPNVKETDDPTLIFTATFNSREFWRDLRLSDFGLK